MMSYASVVEPLRASNLLLNNTFYQLAHISISKPNIVSSGGAIINADFHLGNLEKHDLVLVIAGGNPFSFNNENLFQWLRQLASRGVALGGISGGPVILANAGVMTNRRMTVHWEHVQKLKEAYPLAMLEKTLYVIDRDRTTCAGGIAPLDLMHALITEHHGAKFAQIVSDWFMHTHVRPAGGQQRAGLVERYQTTNTKIISAIGAMSDHISDTLSLAQLAKLSDVRRRQLIRHFQNTFGQSPMEFYRNMRLEKAQNLLKQSTLSITEIALATGFSGSSHFSYQYRKKFGSAPSLLRK